MIISSYTRQNLDDLRELQLTAEDGKTMYALNVFSQSIRYLKDAFLRQNNDAGFNWEEQDIRWVLTVPAIWPEEAISFMRKAAEKVSFATIKITDVIHVNLTFNPFNVNVYNKQLSLHIYTIRPPKQVHKPNSMIDYLFTRISCNS